MGFEIVTDDFEMRRNLEIEYRVKVFGLLLLPWRSLITEYNPPFCFVDEALKSPYALWRHRHEFRQTARDTAVTDHVDYALPFFPFGEAGHFAVRRQLAQIFGYRQKCLGSLLGGTVIEIREPAIR